MSTDIDHEHERVPFDDERVRALLATSGTSQSFHVDKLLPLVINQHDIPSLGTLSEEISDSASVEDSKSYKTLFGSTPPRGRGHPAARRYLLAWLHVAKHLRCPISDQEPVAKSVVQVAHILLPRKENNNLPFLLWHEYMLGMRSRSICIHSRIFLMPLSATIHALLDGHLIALIPKASCMRKLSRYLEDVLVLRRSESENQRKDKDRVTVGYETQVQDQDMWKQLRQGIYRSGDTDFAEFADGSFHEYILLPHPKLHRNRPEKKTFFSHISPFAAALNALGTLHKWSQKGSVTPTAPTYPNPASESDPVTL